MNFQTITNGVNDYFRSVTVNKASTFITELNNEFRNLCKPSHPRNLVRIKIDDGKISYLKTSPYNNKNYKYYSLGKINHITETIVAVDDESIANCIIFYDEAKEKFKYMNDIDNKDITEKNNILQNHSQGFILDFILNNKILSPIKQVKFSD